MLTKTFWLTFTNGDVFLGAAVIRVTQQDAQRARETFPTVRAGDEWFVAAVERASRVGCNPGGEIGLMEVADTGPLKIEQLMTKEDVADFYRGIRLADTTPVSELLH